MSIAPAARIEEAQQSTSTQGASASTTLRPIEEVSADKYRFADGSPEEANVRPHGSIVFKGTEANPTDEEVAKFVKDSLSPGLYDRIVGFRVTCDERPIKGRPVRWTIHLYIARANSRSGHA